MYCSKLLIALIIFGSPYFCCAEESGFQELKKKIETTFKTSGRGSYNHVQSAFGIPVDVKTELSEACTVTAAASKTADDKKLVLKISSGKTEKEIVLDDQWESHTIDEAQDFYQQYEARYLTSSRCLFVKTLILGNDRGIPNAIVYNIDMSCPKGFSVQQMISCRLAN